MLISFTTLNLKMDWKTLSQIGSTECFSLELKYNGVGVANGIF
jgi:hypothetical protein